MRAHWRYLKYVLRHRRFVAQAARRYGVPWLGFLHDWSKFLPSEWFPYVRRFYGGPHRPWAEFSNYEKQNHHDAAWRLSAEGVKESFDRAFHAHQRRNKHHPGYYVLYTHPQIVCLPMPERYVREMLADWDGARLAGADGAKGSTQEWYRENGARLPLHPETRALVERLLGGGFPQAIQEPHP
jgi:hypothetical protein